MYLHEANQVSTFTGKNMNCSTAQDPSEALAMESQPDCNIILNSDILGALDILKTLEQF